MSMDGVLHQMPASAGRVAERRGETSSEAASDETPPTPHAKASAGQGLLSQVLARENMQRAWKRVKANKGAAGVDGMDIVRTSRYLVTSLPNIKNQLMEGTYRPGPVRRWTTSLLNLSVRDTALNIGAAIRSRPHTDEGSPAT